ncbi:PIN domain-containing protein [Donghicola eburneus]|uniref:PIN domain-containing protein n=1 Tax=Donghicola eburneus TaxID=393278 RepID=A0A1M4MUQ0_9RHOB|nr:hypothetical protein [Donghicola eburneus]SCM65833.1 hypothetical protein KARMA_0003 [Donghicola eburneus]
MNEQDNRIARQELRQLELQDGTTEQLNGISTRLEVVEQNTRLEAVRTDFSDLVLQPGRKLIEERKYVTALGIFDAVEKGGPSIQDDPEWHAKIASLRGNCHLHLGQEDQASALFLRAYELDPISPKIRSNAVTGFLIREELEAAVQIAQELLDEHPETPHHWTNFIQANGAIGADLSYLDDVPVSVRHDEQVMLTTLNVLRARDDAGWKAKARDTIAAYPESRPARRYAAEAVLDEAVEVLLAPSSSIAQAAEVRRRAEEAAKDLADLWTTLLMTEVPAHKTHISLLQNAITGFRIANAPERAIEILEPSIDAVIDDEASRTIVAAVALDLGRQDILDRVFQLPFEDKAIMQLEWAIRERDWAQAISVVEMNREDIERPSEIPVDTLLEVLRAIETSQSNDAEAILAIAEGIQDAASMLTTSQLCKRAGMDDVAADLVRRALDMGPPDSRFLRFQLAESAAKLDWQDDVIDLLDGHVDPEVPGHERFRLAVAHARVSKPRQSGETFFSHLRRHAETDVDLQRAAGHFFVAIGKAREAVPWFRRALNLEPNRAHTILALWQALGRSNQKRRADELLDKVVVEELDGEPSDQLNLMQLLWRRGRADVLEQAYDIVTHNEGDPEVCLAFFGMMLMDAFDERAPALPQHDVVELGAWVRLTRPDGDPFEFIVAEEEDQARQHFSASNAIVAAALGQSVGNVFTTDTGLKPSEWTVAEIKPKALHLFHRLTMSFQARFPEQRAFQSMRMIDGDIEPILDVIRQRGSFVEQLFAKYREHPLPLGALAQMSPASLPEIAFSLGQSGNVLFIATGHPHDREVERLPLGKEDCGPLVLDSITAWVLAKLDLLTCVANTFGSMLIPVSAIDELRAWSERVGEAGSESMTLHSEGDSIVRTDHTEDARNSMRAEIDEVVAKIDEGVTSVGIGMPEFENTQVRQMADLLGDQFDTVSVATREGGTVLSLDLRFRQVAREIAGLNAVGIDALLDQLLEVEAIDMEQHAKSMMDLAVQGCGVLSVNAVLLLAAFRADQSDKKRCFQFLVRCLGGPNAEPISHLTVAAAFAELAFQELPALKAQSATGHVLRALVRLNGIAADQIVGAFSARCRDYRVRRYAREWTRGHFLNCIPSTAEQ